MATIISNQQLENHAVLKYNFKLLSANNEDGSNDEFTSGFGTKEVVEENYTEDDNPSRRGSDIDSSSMSRSSKEALIESLMKKTDEMSSNFIKLQMKLESKEEEYEKELQRVKEEAFAQGVEEGKQQSSANIQENIEKGIEQFSSSVSTLESSAKEYESALENIKADLVSAAIDISKEVIDSELSENSAEVAKVLSESLIKELQSASKITLKVNPKDHGVLSESVGKLDHIQVISDSAVREGGVIAISDAGNIDSQISKRFEKVKRVALSE